MNRSWFDKQVEKLSKILTIEFPISEDRKRAMNSLLVFHASVENMFREKDKKIRFNHRQIEMGVRQNGIDTKDRGKCV